MLQGSVLGPLSFLIDDFNLILKGVKIPYLFSFCYHKRTFGPAEQIFISLLTSLAIR